MHSKSKRIHPWHWLILAAVLQPNLLVAQMNTMSEKFSANQHLNQVTDDLSSFEKSKSVDHLQNALKTMENISPIAAGGGVTAPLRMRKAEMWLKLLEVIERHLDPAFDREVPIKLSIVPPPDGVVRWPSGVDPQVIKDPNARAEYEAALHRNRESAKHYNFQLNLGRLDERVRRDISMYLKSAYSTSEADKKEIADVIGRSGLSTVRKQQLMADLSAKR